MDRTITLTLDDEQMKALQSGKAITIKPPKLGIQKWQPKGGDYCILKDFSVALVNNNCTYPKHMTYQTQEQAEQAAKALRSYARQLSWISENNDGWIADWENCDQLKYYVVQTGKNIYDTAIARQNKDLATVYMSELNATKLSKLLNDGIVEF